MKLSFFLPTFSFFGIVFYLLRSVGVYRMALNTGMKDPWRAWVPFLHDYLCAQMGDRSRAQQSKSPFLAQWLLILLAGAVVLMVFSPIFWRVFLIGFVYRTVAWLVGVALFVVAVMSDYWIYRDFEPGLTSVYTVLSVIWLGAIPKFLIRDNVPVGVAGVQGLRQPKYK